MRYLGGHLGVAVTPLLDGQLDAASTERAWAHVHGCAACRSRVEHEGWVKTRLARMAADDGPPPQLLGSLYDLAASTPRAATDSERADAAWAAVGELERHDARRRRVGLAVAGAGSVSVAVFGLASLTGATLGIGGGVGGGAGTPTPSPVTSLTGTPGTRSPAMVGPVGRVHGRLHPGAGPSSAPSSSAVDTSRGGLSPYDKMSP